MVTNSDFSSQVSEKCRVLIIDDELGPRESMRILLKEKYEVRCEDRVHKGISALEEFRPDAIVMDIRMPEMDGIEGLSRIREIDNVVSVIMLTGYGSLETARSAIRLGANDYLKKPFDTNEMMKVIDDNVRRTDFTRRKNETERNLHNLTEVLMTELEESRNLAKLGQASRELAHDLSTPLTVVATSVDLLGRELKNVEKALQSSGGPDFAMEYITFIEEGLKRCTDLLKVWRNLGKKDNIELLPCPLLPLLLKTKREAQAIIGDRDIRLEYNVDGLDEVVIDADSLQLHRTLINILGNAIDAVSLKKGVVTLSAKVQGHKLRIEVADNGPGVPADIMHKIFDPYFTTKEEEKGTGLGLYISKRIVGQHGGELWVQNQSDAGALFYFELPLPDTDY